MLGKRLIKMIIVLALVFIFAGAGSQAQAAEAAPMLAKVQTDKNYIKLSWKKVSGADSYVVYFQKCDGNSLKNKEIMLGSEKTSYTKIILKPQSDYKLRVVARKKSGRKNRVIAKSRVIHAVSKLNNKKTNVKSVTVKPASLQLYIGDTVGLKTAVKGVDHKKSLIPKGHGTEFIWHSSNPAVAEVNEEGILTALSKGRCTIYASSISGVWGTASVNVREPKKISVPGKKEREYTVTYKYTGDIPSGAPAVPAEKTYKAGTAVKKQKSPTLKGYTFIGWDGEVTKMPKKDVTVSGCFTPNKYTLTFKYTNPLTKKDVSVAVKYKYGEKVSEIAEPDFKGYKFKGWKDLPETMPDKDTVVKGEFTKMCKVKALVFVKKPREISWSEDSTSPYNLFETYETEVEAGTLNVKDLEKYLPNTKDYLDKNSDGMIVFAGWYTHNNEMIGNIDPDDQDYINSLISQTMYSIDMDYTYPGSIDSYIEQFGLEEPPVYLPEGFFSMSSEEKDAFVNEYGDAIDEWFEKTEEIIRQYYCDLAEGVITDDILLYAWIYEFIPQA